MSDAKERKTDTYSLVIEDSCTAAYISVDVSTILSNYFTLGYYLNKRISITVGAVGTKGRFDMHWAASFGVNFHPL